MPPAAGGGGAVRVLVALAALIPAGCVEVEWEWISDQASRRESPCVGGAGGGASLRAGVDAKGTPYLHKYIM